MRFHEGVFYLLAPPQAVNEAEALPEDQEYFEKFDYRYCTTACLSAHRKAGFKLPFSAPPPPGK